MDLSAAQSLYWERFDLHVTINRQDLGCYCLISGFLAVGHGLEQRPICRLQRVRGTPYYGEK